MATIQLRRKTTSGNGPLIGSTGSVKQGEPLIDLNGGNLYIAKKDKTASSSAPLAVTDYFEFVNKDKLIGMIEDATTALELDTASRFNVGDAEGCIPYVHSDGYLSPDIIPSIAITNTFVANSDSEMIALSNAEVGDICIRNDLSKTFILKSNPYNTLSNWTELKTPADKVSSVNGKTGAVNISLSELGGVSTSTFNTHVNSNKHLTDAQVQLLSHIYSSEIDTSAGSVFISQQEFRDNAITNAIMVNFDVHEFYESFFVKKFYLAIDGTKVYHPGSTIDGGTY